MLAQTPFIGNTNRDIRYLWDPVVHDRYGEKCYITLISLVDPNQQILQDIEHFGADCGIICFSAYLVLGTYDMLVRCWATRSAYDTFWNGLQRFNVRSRVDMPVSVVDYSGWTHQKFGLTIRDVGAYETEIRAVCTTTTAPMAARTSLDTLRAARLIHKLVPLTLQSKQPSSRIKVYICITLVDDNQMPVMRRSDLDAAKFVAALREVLHDTPHLESISLYFGEGVYDCIAKAVIESHLLQDLTGWLFQIQKSLRDNRSIAVRCETMIVGGQSTVERDVINPDYSDGGPNARLMQAVVSAESAPLVSTLRDPWRAAVFELFDRYYGELLDDGRFAAILESGVRSDLDALWEACMFSIKLESRARKQFITHSFPSWLGDRWHAVAAAALTSRMERTKAKISESSGSPRAQAEAELALAEHLLNNFRKDVKRLALGDYIAITKTLLDHGMISQETVASTMGGTWGPRLEALRDLRNDVGHYNDIEEYEERNEWDRVTRWKSLAESAMSVAKFFPNKPQGAEPR